LVLGAGALLFSCQSGGVTPPVNAAPVTPITIPTATALFSDRETIADAGTGSDPDDGALAAGQFTWWVDLHHAAQTHPFVPPTTGASSGSSLVPPRGHTEDDIF